MELSSVSSTDDTVQQMYENIRNQIAFYLSDVNLHHDRFMRALINADPKQLSTSKDLETDEGRDSGLKKLEESQNGQLPGTKPVPLATFIGFKRIAALITKEEELFDAFNVQSEVTARNTALIFDPTARTIARKEPFYPETNQNDIDKRTLYVEGFNADEKDKAVSIIDSLKSQFTQFGTILLVRTPRFASKKLMGFAFIEFETADSLEKACQAYPWTATDSPVGDCKQFRVLTKERWSLYKSRYLKLQKETSSKSTWTDNEPLIAKQNLISSFNLNAGLPETGSESKRSETPAFSPMLAPTMGFAPGTIVQLDVKLNASSANLDVRKQIRALLNDNSPVVSSEVAYIDDGVQSLEFMPDGTIHQRVYIRLKSAEAADKLVSEPFSQVFIEQMKEQSGAQVLHLTSLTNEQTKDYWKTVGRKVKKKMRK